MSKKLTSWRKQGQTAPTADFDSSTIDYDSPTQPYAGNGQSANSVVKRRSAWSKAVKRLNVFSKNPGSHAAEYAYNSASIAYNTTRNYNGIVVGLPMSTSKRLTAWSAQ